MKRTCIIVCLVVLLGLSSAITALTEEQIDPEGSKSSTKMVPLRVIQPLDCWIGFDWCKPNLEYEKLWAAVNRANTIYAAANIKLWIKSVEYYHIPKIYQGNDTEYTWKEFKSAAVNENDIFSVFPNMPHDAYHDTLDKKTLGGWLAAATALYGDPDEMLVWMMWGSGSSSGASPINGRTVFFTSANIFHEDQPEGWVTSHFAHEAGHFFGPRHPWDGYLPLNPKTNSAFTLADEWDLLHCENPLHFYTSRQDYIDHPCANPKRTYNNLYYLGTPFDPLYAEILGTTYFVGDTVLKGLVRSTGKQQNPPNSFSWEYNVMGYYGDFNVDTRVPAFFSQTQLDWINIYVNYDVPYQDEFRTAKLTYNGNLPKGTTEQYLTSLRTKLGTSNEDFIWWSNGDWSFARETAPIQGTKYQPVSGDFDDDGYDDIIWYNATDGTANIWWGNGNKVFTKTSIASLPKGCTVFAGNFDGKFGADFYLYKSGTNGDKIYWSKGNRTFESQTVEVTGGYKPFAVDFDGDGKTDIFWYAPSSGKVNIWWSNGDRTFTGVNNINTGLKNYTPLVGDFDGKAGQDIFWYRAGSGSGNNDYISWSVHGSRNFSKVAAQNVNGTYKAFVGDFNGDGIGDIFWDAQGAITDSIWAGSESGSFKGVNQAVFGTFIPVAGDFNGDGLTDIFWYRGPN